MAPTRCETVVRAPATGGATVHQDVTNRGVVGAVDVVALASEVKEAEVANEGIRSRGHSGRAALVTAAAPPRRRWPAASEGPLYPEIQTHPDHLASSSLLVISDKHRAKKGPSAYNVKWGKTREGPTGTVGQQGDTPHLRRYVRQRRLHPRGTSFTLYAEAPNN